MTDRRPGEFCRMSPGPRLSRRSRVAAWERSCSPAPIRLSILEFGRGVTTRLTFGSSGGMNPAWSPDGPVRTPANGPASGQRPKCRPGPEVVTPSSPNRPLSIRRRSRALRAFPVHRVGCMAWPPLARFGLGPKSLTHLIGPNEVSRGDNFGIGLDRILRPFDQGFSVFDQGEKPPSLILEILFQVAIHRYLQFFRIRDTAAGAEPVAREGRATWIAFAHCNKAVAYAEIQVKDGQE